ncbi:synembryn-B-like isoform X2 [Rhinatrema bivittatum]|uniref:synembryn-B-like isoform X2 n=1 Tax=Rhinatrema bivittatum TaxID=194408 RepID=UPI00112BEF2B|nr:synembryn-B-like isoform X2 [Rhinatrema bivittatum]
MEEKLELDLVLAVLLSGASEEDIETSLAAYYKQNSTVFKFDVSDEEKRKELCEELLNVLKTGRKPSCHLRCLETLRILSRDKKLLIPVASKGSLQILMKLAQLDPGQECLGEDLHFPIIVEALKCLCNIVFNSPVAQKLSLELNVAAALCKLLQLCQDQPNTQEIKSFTLRLLFLLSLLHTDIRSQLRNELQALPLLTHTLENVLGISWLGKYIAAEDDQASRLSLKDTECAIEALKALFNVTLDSRNVHSENDAQQFRSMTAILRHCLLITGPTEDKMEELHSNSVNLLSNVPVSCLDVLISPEAQEGSLMYNGINMEAIQVLLDFMEKRIDKGSSYREGLTPVLTLLTECSRTHRNIRKFIKAQVLPPLRDVSNRPEVGTTVRNKLVRLMTHVDLDVKQIAAEFLFVLCKERVDSLLKYTGYGNAAGLLAARGLLAGGRGDYWYSDDEDTDTEEYKSAKPNINLITGHMEEPMPNPLDEMTEEQKEYEAMKLVTMFDTLSREEVIKPMGMRVDGSMAPLEEIACNSLTNEPNEHNDSDVD